MAGWSFNKEQSEKDYFLNIIGGLNDKEKIQLQKLKDFLSKENLGYSWLWDRYIDKPIKN